MRLKVYNTILTLSIVLLVQLAQAQTTITGKVTDAAGQPLGNVDLVEKSGSFRTTTKADGSFSIAAPESGTYQVVVFSLGYEVFETRLSTENNSDLNFRLNRLNKELSEVVILDEREKVFNLKRLNPVEGTAIYAGKKSEVILLDQMVGNKAANNPRQVYSQVVGLNIYEGNDAGLQLNIGGRGLDPNRTSNFNTRQNGYDISADVLGYPESYYTPPAEALEEIQVVRGAASLQYGTQFGGLVNFKMKQPVRDKKIEFTSRQSTGSFGLWSSFNSLSGTAGKFKYYTYFHHKQGSGFRPNSEFDSNNAYAFMGYEISDRTNISFEYTYLNYLAQQAGGLTDEVFNTNREFSNRTRNWFEVNWNLASLKLEHKLSEKTDLSVMLFGLNAERNALGFRGNPADLNGNPVTEPDATDESRNFIFPRDLIKGEFKNYGTEVRLLSRYNLMDKDAVFLIGTKFYKANNASIQGPGSLDSDPNFTFQNTQFPDYPSQSNFDFPNLNLSFFGEHIFFLNDKNSPLSRFAIFRSFTSTPCDFANPTAAFVGFPLSS